ncbi:MAG: chemotaxis-specific protein-glutamate methyltransferase CheB [Anaerolineae bacterium]|nr:chemotaxis-specific protein-glutamate methyltransferase CheB [Anaerolineae bacterium]
MKSLKVLVADDSLTYRQWMVKAINGTPDMIVVGEAANGQQAVRLAQNLCPDVITMDLAMPGMDGLDATREIMHARPTPIVVVSDKLDAYKDAAFEAISRGALTVQPKPAGPGDPHHADQVAALLGTIRAMAGVRVIHHWKRHHEPKTPPLSAAPAVPDCRIVQAPGKQCQIIAIVSSTGGPVALNTILAGLPTDFVTPIVIAQHIAPDFVDPLAGWLSTAAGKRVVVAQQGGGPEPGYIYLAPGDAHLWITDEGRFALDRAARAARYVPSGDILLASVARVFGKHALGVVLTGMGDDGAAGLRALYDVGAVTIAQDEATSVVFGMPREAAEMGAARQVLPLQEIARTLVYNANRHRH